MSESISLLKQKYALEFRIHTLRQRGLTESKEASKLLANMQAMLEDIDHRIAESGLPQDQINSPMPVNDRIRPQVVPVSEYDSHPDHEVQMARAELHRAAHCSIELSKMLQHITEQQGLEGWVQAKITKAADYLDSVYHYLEYEMKHPGEVQEAVTPFGPGEESTSDEVQPNGAPKASGEPTSSAQPKTGATSPTPPAGGATPVAAGPGMVKMARLDINNRPLGTPIMVKATDVANQQKQGLHVIGESKEEKKVAHCSQCGKGFSNAGVDAKYKTGFSHCKDHKGMRIIAEMASAGASSAGGIAGNATGFVNGGIGMQKRKKKKVSEALTVDQSPENNRWYVIDGDKLVAGPFIEKATAERKMAAINDRRKAMSRRGFLKGAGLAGAAVATGAAGYGIYKLDQYEQAQEDKLLSQVTDPADIARYKKIKDEYLSYQSLYLSNTKNISYSVMASNAGDKLEKFTDQLKQKYNIAEGVIESVVESYMDVIKKASRDAAIKSGARVATNAKKDWNITGAGKKPAPKKEKEKEVEEGTMADAEQEGAGPEFTGYWKGKDKGRPGKKMVGGN